jgi:hypothetical protein
LVHGVQHLASAKKSSARGSAAIDLYRDREIDACTVDETIHHYHRAAGELYKFCFSRGGGSHAEFIAGILDRVAAGAETIDWWERATPRRASAHNPHRPQLHLRGGDAVTDHGHASPRLSTPSRLYVQRLPMDYG